MNKPSIELNVVRYTQPSVRLVSVKIESGFAGSGLTNEGLGEDYGEWD